MDRRFTVFPSLKSKRDPQNVSLRQFLADVELGKWRESVERIRSCESKDEASHLKNRLPIAKVSGTFDGLKATDIVEPSGLLCLDLDDLGARADEVRRTLKADVYVLAFFVSPSGRGLKVIVGTQVAEISDHRACFERASVHFKSVLPADVLIDPRPSNVASNCFASFDSRVWRASSERLVFGPGDCDSEKKSPTGCDVDASHVMQSFEKELFSPSSSERAALGREDSSRLIACNHMSTPPAHIDCDLSEFVERNVWRDWVSRTPYVAAKRNAFIADRVPLLLNLVCAELVAVLSVKWFDGAPGGLFHDTRERHWNETWSMIGGCRESWPTVRNIGRDGRRIYQDLKDDRLRAVFRICHSLSISKKNFATRQFYLTATNLSERMLCACQTAARQLNYLENAGAIKVIEKGELRRKGHPARATFYQWMLS
ncbi:BT4734/BF3469 family protein [Synoicihabitans lomoniglobus]|nr:hypothetical protein [Opitutaceae bacterium LMO-M01]